MASSHGVFVESCYGDLRATFSAPGLEPWGTIPPKRPHPHSQKLGYTPEAKGSLLGAFWCIYYEGFWMRFVHATKFQLRVRMLSSTTVVREQKYPRFSVSQVEEML